MESKEQQSQELLQEKEAFLQQSGQQHRETYTQMKDALENAKDQVRKLSARVVLSEQKCEALQRQLNQSEAKSKDLDLKLTRLCSAVRLTVHKGHTRPSHTPGSRKHTASFRECHLPGRGMFIYLYNNVS